MSSAWSFLNPEPSGCSSLNNNIYGGDPLPQGSHHVRSDVKTMEIDFPKTQESPCTRAPNSDQWLVTPGTEKEFKFTFTRGESCPFFGVSTKKYAQVDGYRVRMFGFGGPGNLSSGSSLIKCSWGPKPKPDNTLRMRVKVGHDYRVQVWYQLENRPLGLAYDVPSIPGIEENGGVIPILSGRDAAGTIEETDVTMSLERTAAPSNAFAATSKTADLLNAGNRRVIITLNGSKIHCKVVNSLTFKIQEDKTIAGTFATRMSGPPELMNIEEQLHAMLAGSEFEKQSDGSLVFTKNSTVLKFIPTEVEEEKYVHRSPEW